MSFDLRTQFNKKLSIKIRIEIQLLAISLDLKGS